MVPSTPTDYDVLIEELKDLATTLNVEDRLLAIKATARFIERDMQDAYYYLINLDMEQRRLSVTPYTRTEVGVASTRLAELELEYRHLPQKDVLLASVPSVKQLKRAYPNYFADTDVFLRELRRVMRG